MAVLGQDVDVELAHAAKLTLYWTPGTSPGATKVHSVVNLGLVPGIH